jgi:hypothetical protein
MRFTSIMMAFAARVCVVVLLSSTFLDTNIALQNLSADEFLPNASSLRPKSESHHHNRNWMDIE